MLKKLTLAALACATLTCAAFTTVAQAQMLAGLAGGVRPNEPNYAQVDGALDALLIVDFPDVLRMSVNTASFENPRTTPTSKLNITVIGFQQLYRVPIDRTMQIIGAVGAGFYRGTFTGQGKELEGLGLGLMLDGSFRWLPTRNLVLDAGVMFRDAAIQLSVPSNTVLRAGTGKQTTVDAGWSGAYVAIGFPF